MTRELAVPSVSYVLGSWLFVSRLNWPHSPSQFLNTLIVSVLYSSLAVAAIGLPIMRYAKLAVALWLFASVWLVSPIATATLWNNLLVAIAMLALASSEMLAKV